MTDQIRIVLADDHVVVRNGLSQILDSQPGFTVVGQAGDSHRLLGLIEDVRPDVLLLDVEMPGDDVAQTYRRVAEISPDTKVLILSMYDGNALVRTLIEMGVRGYLLKSVTQHELVASIRAVCEDPDRIVLSVSQQTMSRLNAPDEIPLTSREREVLELTAEALSNAQIGRRLGLTEATVKRHLHNVFAKLDAVSRIDAVNKAIRMGLLSPSDKPGSPNRR